MSSGVASHWGETLVASGDKHGSAVAPGRAVYEDSRREAAQHRPRCNGALGAILRYGKHFDLALLSSIHSSGFSVNLRRSVDRTGQSGRTVSRKNLAVL